jgi:Papain family cysteine protease
VARRRRVKRILNCIPSREIERDWRLEHAEEAGVVAAPKTIPTSKDLRAAWWKVGDQGESGSCVGWASAEGVLRWHFVQEKLMKQTERLSPRFQWMASKETDQMTSQPTTFIETAGTSIKTALDVARKFGSVRDTVLPFASGKLYGGEAKTFYAIAAQLKITAYFNVSLSTGHQLDDWRRWIATNGPILTRLGVDRTWDNASDTKGNLDTYLPQTVRGGHAVALVGYTPDRFIVRNSWGTSWGDGGFGYASLAYAQDAFTEAYGAQA